MPRHTDEIDLPLSPSNINPHNNLNKCHAVLNAPVFQPYTSISPRSEVYTPNHVHVNPDHLQAVVNRSICVDEPSTCTMCEFSPGNQCVLHGITNVIPNASPLNRSLPQSPKLSCYVDHRSSSGLIPGSYSSTAPAANAWLSPSSLQGRTAAHAHWAYNTPIDDATLDVIVQDYDVPYENDFIVETDGTYHDTMNALTSSYEQYLSSNEPDHCCTICHINFPCSNDLENHSIIHESYYNPLLGHSYTEEPSNGL